MWTVNCGGQKSLWAGFSGEGNLTQITHLSCLFVCHPHQVPVIQVITPSVCVCVCGKGVATHTELVAYKQTMRDTQLRRERAEAE